MEAVKKINSQSNQPYISLKVWLLSWTVRETVFKKVLISDIFLSDMSKFS